MTALTCPMCKAFAEFTLVFPDSHSHTGNDHAIAARCTSCDVIIGGRARASQITDYWPQDYASKDFPDVPEGIAAAASEAHKCMSTNCHRAGLAMARAAVQGTAKYFDIKSDLYKAIDELVKKGHLTAAQGEVAHEIRLWGNDAAHGDLAEAVDPVEAAEVVAFMDEVLNSAFQQGARLQRIRLSREARRTEQ